MMNDSTGSINTPNMPTILPRSSTRLQDRSRSSTGSRVRSISIKSDVYKDFNEDWGQNWQNWDLGENLNPVPFPSGEDDPYFHQGAADFSGLALDFAPNALVAVPGAGTQTQQDWDQEALEAVLIGESNVLQSYPHGNSNIPPGLTYPDPQAAYSQYQPPWSYRAVPPVPQRHGVDPQLLSSSVQGDVYLFPDQDEELYAPVSVGPSKLGKRSRVDSDDYTKHSNVSYKRIRTGSDETTIASSVSGGTSISSVSDASERKMLQQTRRMKKRSSAFSKAKFEKPKASDDRPWVRINNTTQGKTTRTAKINNFNFEYEERNHPLGNWQGSHFTHKYSKTGEFEEKKMSAEQIREFILEYPKGKGAKLKLWIQRGPADSARRYKTPTLNKCRFKDCPSYAQTGSILHGHYRISFDETWHRDRENVDPFLTAGYVHLYCMERFLDFPEICRKADVEVDTRQLTNEPKGRFAATLANQPECGIAQNFVNAAHHKKLQTVLEFANYPRHKINEKVIQGGRTVYHEDSLTFHMHTNKEAARPPAQKKQFEQRGDGETHLHVHLGDLERCFTAIKAQKKDKKKASKKKRKYDSSEDEDDEEPTRSRRIPRAPRKKSRQHQADSDSEEGGQFATVDDSEPDDNFNTQSSSHALPQRSSTRIQKRAQQPNYTDDGPLFEPEHSQLQQFTRQQIEQLVQQVQSGSYQFADEALAPSPRGRVPSHEDHLFKSSGDYLANHSSRIPIDPALIAPSAIGKPGRQSSGQSIGAFSDTNMEQTFDFAQFDGIFADDDNDNWLFRGRSRVSMSKSIMKKPSGSTSRRNTGDSARRVSIGKTTTREFDSTQSPHTVSSEGRRHSLRLQNQAASGRLTKP